MSRFFILLGLILVGYTLVAYCWYLPQLTDFLPLNMGSGVLDEHYYKVVSVEGRDDAPIFVLGLGSILIVQGLAIEYIHARF